MFFQELGSNQVPEDDQYNFLVALEFHYIIFKINATSPPSNNLTNGNIGIYSCKSTYIY